MIPAPRNMAQAAWPLIVPVGVGAVVLVLAAVAFAALEIPIARGFALMWAGAFGSPAAIHDWLLRSGVLILTGLATGVALRIALYNFGAEGQVLAGALVAMFIATKTASWPAWVVFPLDLAAGALAGALLMLAAVLLKLRRGVEEAIVTLLLNVVMVLLVQVAIEGPLAGRAISAIMAPTGIPAALFIALAASIGIATAIRFTVWGFELRALAGNPEAARFAGIPVGRVTMRVGLVSGALAGMAGVCQIANAGGDPHTGLGFAGIAVATLACLSPLGILAAAFFVAAVMVGAEAAVGAGAPAALPHVFVALTLLASLIGAATARRRAGTVAKATP
jgi:simple sugar transport system permease protein